MRSITFFLSFVPILALVLLTLNLVFAPHSPYQEKSSTFECGFHSFLGQNRTQFSISFFIYALLFLLFDLELLVIYPYVVSSYENSGYGLVIMLIFFSALTVGFAFELGKKALAIDSRQTINNLLAKQKKPLQSSLLFKIFHDLQLPKLIDLIYGLIRDYFKHLSLSKLFKGAMKIRLFAIAVSIILLLSGMITQDQFSGFPSVIITIMILYSFIKLPLKKKVVMKFLITLFFNCAILTIAIYIFMYFYSPEIIIPLIVIFLCPDYNPFDGMIVKMDPYGEGKSGPSKGPSKGPFGGPPEPEKPTEPSAPKKTYNNSKTNEGDETLDYKEMTFVHRWLGIERPSLRNQLDYCVRNNVAPDASECKALGEAVTEHFSVQGNEAADKSVKFANLFSQLLIDSKKSALQNQDNLKRAMNMVEEVIPTYLDKKKVWRDKNYQPKPPYPVIPDNVTPARPAVPINWESLMNPKE